MNANSNLPPHQAETEFTGEVQTFSGPALSPNDPCLEPRERKGRPAGSLHRKGTEQEAPRQAE